MTTAQPPTLSTPSLIVNTPSRLCFDRYWPEKKRNKKKARPETCDRLATTTVRETEPRAHQAVLHPSRHKTFGETNTKIRAGETTNGNNSSRHPAPKEAIAPTDQATRSTHHAHKALVQGGGASGSGGRQERSLELQIWHNHQASR